ncbi:MAG: TIM-barrel signal transduction protein [bacterium ADurb.Bin400]|nr:MAG: TIM-barrel signal transduction protein [bacterium ADurb.Bin400]
MLAGVNGTDPFVLMPQFLAELKAMGFSGVQNFPTIGLFDGQMHDYYDMRALCPDTEQYLLYFYSGGRWHCYIGRILNEDEANRMQIL